MKRNISALRTACAKAIKGHNNNNCNNRNNNDNNNIGYTHPTVYKLIDSIRLEQAQTENLKGKIDTWQNVVKKNQKYVRATTAIRRLVDNFNQWEPLDY